jgi:hypothetical protein
MEGACRLRQDAAEMRQGGVGLIEYNGGLAQNNALHVRLCAHNDVSRDLPDDVLGLWAKAPNGPRVVHEQEEHFHGWCDNHGTRCLYDERAVFIACESELLSDVDVSVEGVDAGRQNQSIIVELTAQVIEMGGGARHGVSVRGKP